MKNRTVIDGLRSKIREHTLDLTLFIQELIKTPSVNGKNNEIDVANLIKRKAVELNLPVKFIASDKLRPNVFIGNNFSSNKDLLLIAHLDTVDAGDLNKWQHNPFGGEIEGGRLYGRGAIDCKTGIALSVYTLKILNDLGYKNISKFVGVVDEESGADSKLGTKYLLGKGLNARAAIYTYPGVDTVTIGHRGLVRLWVEVNGESAHTGSLGWQKGERGASAIEALVKFINSLSGIEFTEVNKFFPEYTFKHTVTMVEGGSGESIVPDRARVLIDVRLLPNHNNGEYIDRIAELSKGFETNKIKFHIKVKNNVSGVVISPKEPIVKILDRLDREIMGKFPEIRGCGPANEGYMLINAGIPTICGFGAEGDGVHSADEYLKVETLPKILEIYVRTAIELAS